MKNLGGRAASGIVVLVTGADGFIGKNLVVALKRRQELTVLEADVETPTSDLVLMTSRADVIFHLAGVNRPSHEAEFFTGNVGPIEQVCGLIRETGRKPLVVLSSSTQAAHDNAYGRSKRAAEGVLQEFARETGASVRIFRLPGVFGKWCRPDYNSVVATFCHNIARGLPITISDPAVRVTLVHVGDVVRVFTGLLGGVEPEREGGWCMVTPAVEITLGELAGLIRSFRDSRADRTVPQVSTAFERALYSTYLSYLPQDSFAYSLDQRVDPRGELAELLRSPGLGQLFVSRTRPGITRGNHYHDQKVEKFAVLEGEAMVRFRSILGGEVLEYSVSGSQFRVVDIPPGYAHNISNVGEGDLVVVFWASEPFDPESPDTYASEV